MHIQNRLEHEVLAGTDNRQPQSRQGVQGDCAQKQKGSSTFELKLCRTRSDLETFGP